MEDLARVLLPVLNLCFMICTGFFLGSIFTPKAALVFKERTRIKGLLFWGSIGFLVMILAAILAPYHPELSKI